MRTIVPNLDSSPEAPTTAKDGADRNTAVLVARSDELEAAETKGNKHSRLKRTTKESKEGIFIRKIHPRVRLEIVKSVGGSPRVS